MKNKNLKVQGLENALRNKEVQVEKLKHHNNTLQGIIDKGGVGITKAQFDTVKSQNAKLGQESKEKDNIIGELHNEYRDLSIEFATYKRSKIMLWVFGTMAAVYAGGLFLRVIS